MIYHGLMNEVVIVAAARSPIGRRQGSLSGMHPAELLGAVQLGVLEQAGIDPVEVGQVLGGAVTQVGEQSYNVTRTAWLGAGLPSAVAATTIDAQCGSSQQAVNLATGLIGRGSLDVVLACGVESMSRVPLGSGMESGPGSPFSDSYLARYDHITQFEAAERIADRWGITRSDTDAFGLLSQERAARAWSGGRYDPEVMTIEVARLDEEGSPTGLTQLVSRDDGLRATSLEQLAALAPIARPNGVHTAGTSSQISDGAAAVLLMSKARAQALGLESRARITHECLIGVDPVDKLTGPIPATRRILSQARIGIDDLDLIEINEAFAAIVLAWERELKPDMDRVNPNGGAIALGHPVGSTGVRLVTTALHELERSDGTLGLVTMCCGGGLGTGTLLERV